MKLERLMSDCKQLNGNNRLEIAVGDGWAPHSVYLCCLKFVWQVGYGRSCGTLGFCGVSPSVPAVP